MSKAKPDIIKRIIKVARNKRTPEEAAFMLFEAGREIERLWFCQELLTGTTAILEHMLKEIGVTDKAGVPIKDTPKLREVISKAAASKQTS